MIAVYVTVAIIGVIGIAAVIPCIYWLSERRYYEESILAPILAMIGIIIVTLAICGGIIWYLYGTEDGKRAIKDTKSNIYGGIERTVTVYDINGEIIQQYQGKFDVAYDAERIKFDDEKGKRHIIYYTTGTVIIDEK
ncbi:MAG: hypothetical protein HFE76_16935 [Firmicutes bacterium]|nr:hypothetical protein [Bacillota bacterium]